MIITLFYFREREAVGNCFIFISKLAFEVFNSSIFCCGQCSCNINFHWVQFQRRKLYFPGSYQGSSCFKTILAAMLHLYVFYLVLELCLRYQFQGLKNLFFGLAQI